jgi:RNase P subunit RPR2
MLPNNPLTQYFRQPAIYIQLPSQGKFYPAGTLNLPPNGEIPILPMTSVDEITYRTPDALFNGTATVNVIKSCVPSIRDPWAMPSADLDAVLVGIRIASYGHAMDLDVQCPACNTDDEISVDLRAVNDRLKIGDYNQPLAIGDLEFWFQPINYKSVNENSRVQLEQQQAMRVLDSDVEDKVKLEQLNRSMMLITETTTKTIAQSIATIKTPQAMVHETEYIVDFLKNCDSKMFNQLRDHVIRIKQQSDIQPLVLTCKNCNHSYTQPFTLDLSSFFDNAS